MKTMKKELRIGLAAETIFIICNQFFNIPDFFLGFLEGIAICFIIVGILPEKAYSKLKLWKSSIIRKV